MTRATATSRETRQPSTPSWESFGMTALPEILDCRLPSSQEHHRAIIPARSRSREPTLALNEADTSEMLRSPATRPDALSRRQISKSFSSLGHALNELRLVSRRASMSLRRKNSVNSQALKSSVAGESCVECKRPNTSCNKVTESLGHSRTPGWLRRVASTSFRQRRDSSTTPSPTYNSAPHVHSVTSPVPGSGSEPPILPYDPASGAAARAAAAAQNEMLGVARVLTLREDIRLAEPKLV